MSFPRFFISEGDCAGDRVFFRGESASHIGYSLRMKPGEKVVACDGKGREYLCELVSFSPDEISADIIDVRRSAGESPCRPVIVQACPKGDKADTVVMKSVELGACGIVFFLSSRSVVKYTEKEFAKKKERWERIALEAAKQSGRGVVPFVTVLPDTAGAAGYIKGRESCLCYENEETVTLKNALSGKVRANDGEVVFIIGPEGGFTEKEAELFKEAGAVSVSLSRRILRTETASSFVLSCLAYETEL